MPVDTRLLAATPAELASALDALGDPPVVGVDVERADAHRYWRRPALIQLGADGVVVLADPLATLDMSVLDAYLSQRTVVLHAMDNDIAPLASVGIAVGDIEDTAVAAAMLGLPTGLETLLADILDVHFDGDKQRMQRADWARRPLTDDMLAYAAADVADLPRLWRTLHRRLADEGRLEWYAQERDALRDQPPIEERRAWTRMRGVGRLDGRAQTRARALWQTRETLARDTDTAPNRIVSDRVLLDLAAEPVDDERQLRRAGVRRQSARRFGSQLLRALRDATPAPATRPHPRRFDDRERALVDDLRARRSVVAQDVGIDPGVLCPNRALEQAVARRAQTPAELRDALELRPWQWSLLAATFTEALTDADTGTPTT
ncbi:MAG TPA: HRDC domain-containing protein [Euzebyales bacterium]